VRRLNHLFYIRDLKQSPKLTVSIDELQLEGTTFLKKKVKNQTWLQ
jgi:hypothetical protein